MGREWAESDSGDPLYFTDVRQRVGEKDRSNFNKLVDSQGFQRFLDEAKVHIRTVENRKAFVRTLASFEMLEELWGGIGEEFDELQDRLWELEETGVFEGPEYEAVHERFMQAAADLGLVH